MCLSLGAHKHIYITICLPRMTVVLIILGEHQRLRVCDSILHSKSLHRNRSIWYFHTILLHQICKRQHLWDFIFCHSLLYDFRVVVRALRVHTVCLGITYMLQPLQTPDQLRQTLPVSPGYRAAVLHSIGSVLREPFIQGLPCLLKLSRVNHVLVRLTGSKICNRIRQLVKQRKQPGRRFLRRILFYRFRYGHGDLRQADTLRHGIVLRNDRQIDITIPRCGGVEAIRCTVLPRHSNGRFHGDCQSVRLLCTGCHRL